MLDPVAIARLCAWLEHAALPAPPLERLPGVQAFDVELLRRQTLRSVQASGGDYDTALARLRYLAARYGSPRDRGASPTRRVALPPQPQRD
jgi:hypothetical protein